MNVDWIQKIVRAPFFALRWTFAKSLHSPATWAVSYLFSIVFFALIYSTLDGAFTQSTSTLEPRTRALSNQVIKYIEEEYLLAGLISGPRRAYFDSEKNSIEFEYYDKLVRPEDYEFRISIMRGSTIYPHITSDFPEVLQLIAENNSRSLGPAFIGEIENPPYEFADDFLTMSITRLITEHRSIVSSGFQNLPRMLYFSSVTATTLGYGDITPISDVGRLLVAFQTIMSISFFGLFLNALAFKASKGQ